MSDWRERLRATIQLVSPSGKIFDAKWRNSPRTIDKKVGVFEFPRMPGNLVQDLDINSARYSLTFFFDGPNNDIFAAAFFEALRERGTWIVEHPVHGQLVLQPLSATENNNPTDSGNLTEINSEWIEPIDEFSLVTARELLGKVDAQIAELNGQSAEQFDDQAMEFPP
jgi:hypothetical protein